MNLEARKIEFVQEFFKLRSEKAISKFEKLLQQEKASEKVNASMTSVELNARIDKASQDSKADKLTEAKVLLVEIDKWQ
jgi:DNA polymerase III delta prime subunit